MLEYQNIKKFFGNGYIRNWSLEVFVIKRAKTICHGHMLLVILTVKKD